MGELLDGLREKDEDTFHRWTKSEAWATVEQLMEANGSISFLYYYLAIGNESVPIQLAQCSFPELAISNAKI